MGNYTLFFRCLKILEASKKFYDKSSENSRSQIVLRTDIFRKLTLIAPGDIRFSEYFKQFLELDGQ